MTRSKAGLEAVLVDVASKVGRQCLSGRDPDTQIELARSVELLDRCLIENVPMTIEELSRFKEQQGAAKTPKAGVTLKRWRRYLSGDG